MESSWVKILRYNPISPLMEFGDPLLQYFTQRDLLDGDLDTLEKLWDSPVLHKLLAKQNNNGSWSYPKRKNAHPIENYDLLQTYRNLRILIETYGMNRDQSPISRAVEYLFSHQSSEGDIRGIFGSQYAPHYTGGMLELIIKAGYEYDPRVQKTFRWYEETRQVDGGWAWSLRTTKTSYKEAIEIEEPVVSAYSKPFSHALTMFVIRAYAAHSVYRSSSTAHQAGELVKSRFFQADKYSDRKSADYWFKYQYPFWWGNLLTAMDSLSRMDFTADDPDVIKGLEWFVENQQENGLWPTGYGKGEKVNENQAWVCLAICRVIMRFYKL